MSLKLTASLHLSMGCLEDDRFHFWGAKASLAGVKLAVSFREFFGFPETNSDSFEHGCSNPPVRTANSRNETRRIFFGQIQPTDPTIVLKK